MSGSLQNSQAVVRSRVRMVSPPVLSREYLVFTPYVSTSPLWRETFRFVPTYARVPCLRTPPGGRVGVYTPIPTTKVKNRLSCTYLLLLYESGPTFAKDPEGFLTLNLFGVWFSLPNQNFLASCLSRPTLLVP
jgi:hypothetical protein